MFENAPTISEMEVFEHDGGFGILVRFSETGLGFGEITFFVDKQDGSVRFDPEDMSMEKCASILMRTVGTKVLEFRNPFEEREVVDV